MKHHVSFGLAVTLLAGVCAGIGFFPSGGNGFQEAKDVGRPKVVVAVGTIQPAELADVGTQLSGRIIRLGTGAGGKDNPITYNSVVKEGTILAQIDPTRYEGKRAKARADLKRAESGLQLAHAKLVLAKRELERVEKHQAGKKADASDVVVAKATVDVAKAAVVVEEGTVAQAKAALEMAETELDYCTIRSPVAGVVIDRRCNVGQTVEASLTAPSLFLIARDLKKLEVWTQVREANAVLISKGQSATFTVDAYPGRTFKGTVAAGQPRLNATLADGKVTYMVVIDVDNSDGKLLPYLTASVHIQVEEKKQK